MFTDTDYIAARVRDAARYLNNVLAQAHRNGLTIAITIGEGQPVRITVEVQPR